MVNGGFSRDDERDARAAGDDRPTSQGKRQQLTFAEKNQLRQHHATISGGAAKQSDMVEWVWATFGKRVGRSSIGRILSSAVDVEEAAMGPLRMRKRFSKYPDVEAALLTFVLEQRENLALLTDDVLWDRARTAAGDRPVSMSWIQRFKSRNGVQVKRRSLLTAGADGDEASGALRDAFVAALTKTRDELLRFTHVKAQAGANETPRKEAASDALVGESDDDEAEEEVVAAAAAVQEACDIPNEQDTETEHSYELDESDADASKQQQPEDNEDETPRPGAVAVAAGTAAPTPDAALPPRRRRDATEAVVTTRAVTRARVSARPRFGIVSQTTGRVELENRSSSLTEHPLSNESSPVRPSRASAVAPPPATASPAVVSPTSFMTPARSTEATPAPPPTASTATTIAETSPSFDRSPSAAATMASFTSPYARSSARRRTSLGGISSIDGSAFDEQLEEERKRKVELEERELELRVEGLRCDNVLKRIKIAEENMLARKRLRDAGVTDDEINEMLPVVKIHQL